MIIWAHLVNFTFILIQTNGSFHKATGWVIIYRVITCYNFQINIVFLSLKIHFVLANSADPDEMPHCAAFQQSLHYLP